MSVTLAQAQAQLTAWLNASTAVAEGQRVQIGDISLTRASTEQIIAMIKHWSGEVARLSSASGSSGPRVRGVEPVG